MATEYELESCVQIWAADCSRVEICTADGNIDLYVYDDNGAVGLFHQLDKAEARLVATAIFKLLDEC